MTVQEMAIFTVEREAIDPRVFQLYEEVARRAGMSVGEARFRIHVLALIDEEDLKCDSI